MLSIFPLHDMFLLNDHIRYMVVMKLANSWLYAVDLFQSQESICSYECTQEDESESSDDDEAEAQNAFEKFISQNKLSMSHSLSDNDRNLEADMEEQENAPPGTKTVHGFCCFMSPTMLVH